MPVSFRTFDDVISDVEEKRAVENRVKVRLAKFVLL